MVWRFGVVAIAVLGVASGGCKNKGGAGDVAVVPNYQAHPLAAGAILEKVAWFQGVEKVLYQIPGVFSTGQRPPPVIAGREGMLRVHVAPDAAFAAREVAVVVTVTTAGAPVVLSQVATLDGPWDPADLDTTFNFNIPGNVVTTALQFDVSVHEVTPAPPAGAGTPDAEQTSWTTTTDGLDVEPSDMVELVIIPIQYDADGSGRVPDLSPAVVADIGASMMAIYPATEIVVTVADPLPWSNTIGATSGWTQILQEISQRRSTDPVRGNTYYYGMFNPAESLDAFCGFGCILGLSLLSPNSADNWARASVGLGYPGEQIPTLLHEVGHAHGREHAPCNLYGQASDPQYPYSNAQLGSAGYDILTGEMVSPTAASDVMSYCQPFWVSDYTFDALHRRISDLIDRRAAPGEQSMQMLSIDGDGTATLGALIEASPDSGVPVQVELLDAQGEVLQVVSGGFVPYDHLPGGIAVVPQLGRHVVAARVR